MEGDCFENLLPVIDERLMVDLVMDTAKVTTNGQVTIPADFRRLLDIKPGNKVLFFQRENGDVVIENASLIEMKKSLTGLSGDLELPALVE